MFVLRHCLDCILFQESSLKDLWWTLMQAASTFCSEKIKARSGGVIVFVIQRCVWLGSLKGHLMFSYTPCLSSTIFTWSYLSLQQEKVLPAVKLLNWYGLHFSVESFFLLYHVKRERRGGRGEGDEVWSLCSHRLSSFPNVKNYYSLAWCLEEWVWTNFKYTGMTCSNQIISVCNPVSFGTLLSITHSCRGLGV